MMLQTLDQLSPSYLKTLDKHLLRTLARRKLELYRPYSKQRAFHEAGAKFRERLLRAGNQLGKSYAGAAEAAYHATGKYPEGWNGKRFGSAGTGWCGGVTGEVTRDTIQRLLIGPVGERGTGLIPHRDIINVIPARGVADLADTIIVKHVDGGKSRIRLKYYEQGREKWQADTVQWVWFDEEPPEDIYYEGLTRTNATGGVVWMTFTPLLGMSNVVRRFLMEPSPDRIDINMTLDDAEHIPVADRKKIIDSYPAHEREARVNGTPILGSGAIFPIADSDISCERFEIPNWFRVIGGLDFGWDHPNAAVKLAYNPDEDIIYVTDAYKQREVTPVLFSARLKPWGKTLPWAWPHDGLQHDKGSGVQLAEQYRTCGLNMLDEKATFEDTGGFGVEAGISEMLERMQTGRWKVFDHLTEWFEEKRLYHRKDGKIVKEFDDLLSGSRVAMMMLRYAESAVKSGSTPRRAQGTSGLI